MRRILAIALVFLIGVVLLCPYAALGSDISFLPPTPKDLNTYNYYMYYKSLNPTSQKVSYDFIASNELFTLDYPTNNDVGFSISSTNPSTFSSYLGFFYEGESNWRGVGTAGVVNMPNNPFLGVLYSNFTILSSSGELVYEEPPTYPVYDGWTGVNFLSPRDGFEDNSILWHFRTNYRVAIMPDFTSENFDIEIEGQVEGSGNIVYHDFKLYPNEGYAEGFLDFDVELKEGHNIVWLHVKEGDFTVASDFITVYRLSGFIDENADGLDDRTGRTDNNTLRDPSEDIGTIFENNGDVSNLVGGFKNMLQGVGEVGNIFTSFFKWLPDPVKISLTTFLLALIFLATIRLIRGN